MTISNVFDSRGRWVGLPQDEVQQLDEAARAAYHQCREAADACNTVETELAVAEEALRNTIQKQREVEQQLAKIPRPSRIDLVKQMIRDSR
jgi:hypothetical protein